MTKLHYRFLRESRPNTGLSQGDFIPDLILQDGLTLHSLIRDGAIIIALSVDCEPCKYALNALDEYTTKYRDNFIVLISMPKDLHVELQDYFTDRAMIFLFDDVYECVFGEKGIPWGYGINSAFQVVTERAFNRYDELDMIVSPFRIVREGE